LLHIRSVLRSSFICVLLQQKGIQVRECCNIGYLEHLRRIHALGQHCDVQRFTYQIQQHSWSMIFAKCQSPLREIQTFSSISTGGDRRPLTYPHLARTHPQLHTAQPALSPYPRLSRPQISKRVVLDRATTALRQNYYDMKTLLWSLPQRPMRAPVASARQQTHKGCWNVTIETTRRR
jgi:hypothetical protein